LLVDLGPIVVLRSVVSLLAVFIDPAASHRLIYNGTEKRDQNYFLMF